MGFVIPTGIKDAFEQLPTGYIVFNIDDVQEGQFGKEGEEVYGFSVALTAEEPAEVTGISKEEKFFLGVKATDKRVTNGRMQADPMAEKEETLLKTLGRFKAFAAAAGVEIEGKDTDVIFSELKNRKVIGKVDHKILPARKGEEQSNTPFAQVSRWLPLGSLDPHITMEAPAGAEVKAPASAGPQPTRAAAPAPKPAAAPAPAGRPTPQRLGGRTATA